MQYDWICHVCENKNLASSKTCESCGSLPNLSDKEIRAAKGIETNGKRLLVEAYKDPFNRRMWLTLVVGGLLLLPLYLLESFPKEEWLKRSYILVLTMYALFFIRVWFQGVRKLWNDLFGSDA